MSSVKFRDSDGNVYYLNMADGNGTFEDPFVGPGDASATNLPVYVTQSGDGTAQEVYVTGCLMVQNCTGVGGVVEGLLVTGDVSKPLYVHDGGNSLTVDNTSGSPLYIDTSAAASLNVEDGGGSLTVDDGGTSLTVDNTSGSPLYIDTPYPGVLSLSGLDVITRPFSAVRSDFTMFQNHCGKTVFTTGSATQFVTPSNYDAAAGARPYNKYIVKAPTTNDAAIWIASSDSNAAVSGAHAFPIYAGESHEFHAVHLDGHYGIVDVGGHANNSLYIYAD